MKLKHIALVAGFTAVTSMASAAVINTTNGTLADNLNSRTFDPSNPTSTTAFTDSYDLNNNQWNPDEIWEVSGSSTSSAVMMFEIAGYANRNTFGIYDKNDAVNMLELFNGPASASSGAFGTSAVANLYLVLNNNQYHFSTTSNFVSYVTFSSNQFGFYLTSPDEGGQTFYSESWRNYNQEDHLATFRGDDKLKVDANNDGNYGVFTSNNYILAWEDLLMDGTADRDFSDMVIMVESFVPVAVIEPGSIALLGLGLAGLAASRRRQKNLVA